MDKSLNIADVKAYKKGEGKPPLVMVTAYDAPTSRIADAAGVDIILVGDSVGMTVLGYDSTLSVGMDDMLHHVAAVTRANPRPLVIADLPWLSYHLDKVDTVLNASALIKAGAEGVKLEGGSRRLEMIDAILNAEIPVMGHLGLTPQSVNMIGGFKVQARYQSEIEKLIQDATVLADAGCFAIVLECIPDTVAGEVTKSVKIPTIGIGSGPGCDGQVLVIHDLLGMRPKGPVPRFVRKYAELEVLASEAVAMFASDVRHGDYPNAQESYHKIIEEKGK